MIAPPPEFDGFALQHPLGEGAMGRVFLAHDTVLDRPVAIKFLRVAHPSGETRERFIVEARAVARLHHPNIVSVYRVGEVGGHPYLVSEVVRGDSLDRRSLPLPWSEAQRLVHGIAQALAAAHAGGVLHRDIKPGNVLITHDGDVKLCDFGLAKLMDVAWVDAMPEAQPADRLSPEDAQVVDLEDTLPFRERAAGVAAQPRQPKKSDVMSLTDPGALMGTPLYLSPEQWRGEPATARSDVYALGVLAWELCTGEPPFTGTSLPALRERVLTGARSSLADHLPAAAASFAALIDRCLHQDPGHRFASAVELAEALTALAHRREGALPEGNPYRGLLAFDAAHRALFYGRDRSVQAVLDLLRAQPLVVVAGDSGVGKSSLCLAGVLPRIEEGGLEDGRSWRSVCVVPGRAPFRSLVEAIAGAVALPVAALDALLRTTPAELARVLSTGSTTPQGLLLFVDQLEELTTHGEREEVAWATRVLTEIPTRAGGIRVLASARADFLTRLCALPSLGEDLGRSLYMVRPLEPVDLREAIVAPARAKGVEFESPQTVDELVDFCGAAPGGLPLLQFALAELWDRRDEGRRVIPAAALASIGGPAGALARHAELVYTTLVPAERTGAREVLIRLATAERTRLRRTEPELCEGSDARRAALAALVHGRLLAARQTDEGASDTEYTLAHEALLQGWGRLRAWLDEGQERELARQRIGFAAAEWVRLSAVPELLWSARQLSELNALGIVDAQLDGEAARFVAASRRQVLRTRVRRVGLWAGVPLALAVSWAGLTFRAQWALAQTVDDRRGQALQLLAQASEVEAENAALRQNAFIRFDGMAREQGETAWDVALAHDVQVRRLYTDAARLFESAFILDASRPDVRHGLASVLLDRARLLERDHQTEQVHELLERVRSLDESGELLRRWNAPALLKVTTVPAGAEVVAYRYERRGDRRSPGPRRILGAAPLENAALAPGSYLLVVSHSDRPPVRYPVLLERGESLSLNLEIPAKGPDDFVFVPPGRFLYGSTDSEEARRTHLFAQPQHTVRTDGYWIGRTEVTFGEYLAFLDTLPAAEQRRRLPRIDAVHGALSVTRGGDGRWTLMLQPTTHRYEARDGEHITYEDRTTRQRQDWLRFPVTGITWEDAQAYTSWLDRSGRVPGARLCTEHEWERAARGADDRLYPTGGGLSANEANFDETYGRKPRAFGPDEVGSHPASDSPFGVADLAGNVWEWTASVDVPEQVSYRGGSWYESRMNARSNNRQLGERTLRDLVIGIRACAPHPVP